MRIAIFCHSLLSDWNHGNAHFLRGISSELISRGHAVAIYEPHDAWSLQNLRADFGDDPIRRFAEAYPMLRSMQYDPARPNIAEKLAGADLVLVHEWSDPAIVSAVGQHHAVHGGYILLFHDTHHRSVTDPESISRYDLRHYDGVLAFGASIAEVYRRNGWAERVWTWHEAADTRVFFPREAAKQGEVIWIGNWGDDERTSELQEFFFDPVKSLGLSARVHGVRYPAEAVERLKAAGVEYGGWVPNFQVPGLFAHFRLTVHVPRRPYAQALRGVPTIRVFEVLACGIPLISAPWDDCEGLFTPGTDFLVARNGEEMKRHMRAILNDPALARSLSEHGLTTIKARHTCTHRVDELLSLVNTLNSSAVTTGGEVH